MNDCLLMSSESSLSLDEMVKLMDKYGPSPVKAGLEPFMDGLRVIRSPYMPKTVREEIVDDRDPFIDFEDDVKLARSFGCTKFEEREVAYMIRTSAFDFPSLRLPSVGFLTAFA